MMDTDWLIDDSEFQTPIYEPVATVTRKFEEAQHRRDRQGRFTETASVTVGGRPVAVVKPARAADQKLVPVNVITFDASFQQEQGFYVGVGGHGGIGNRYDRFGQYLAQHDTIEAAEVTVDTEGRVGFTNGRHRYAWLRDQGLTAIPVAMTPESVEHAKRHGYLAAVKLAWDESQHPRDKEGQFVPAYVPDTDAPVEGVWDKSGPVVGTGIFAGVEPKWRQQHRALVTQALTGWVGDPQWFKIHAQDALDNAPIPPSGSGKQGRAQAEALLWELDHHGIPNPVPLYRGSGMAGDRPGGIFSWSEDRKVAKVFAKRYGGVVETFPAGTVKGLRLRDYTGDNFGEKQWIVRAGNDRHSIAKFDESKHPRDEDGQFTTFYHGTLREQLDSITAHGLTTSHAGLAWPGLSQPNTIYLGRTKEAAMTWAESTALRLEWKFENPTAVVLEVRVPADVLATSQRTAEPEGNLRVFQDIPPAWIVGVTVGRSHDAILGLPDRPPPAPPQHIVPPFVFKAEGETFYVGVVVEGRHSIAKQEHSYGNTQIQIAPTSSAAAVLNVARASIRDEHLMGDGKDVDPNHVTVRFGLLNEDLDSLRSFIAAQTPFEASMGEIELFPASEHSDGAVPVVARVISPELHAIEAEIGKHADFKDKSFPVYKPHCTIAYCKPDAAPLYVDLFVHGTFVVQSITISHQSGVQETIPFGMAQKWDVVTKRTYVRQPAGTSHGGEFMATLHGPRDALDSLLNEERDVSIDRNDVRRFLELAGEQMEDPNISHLQVEGLEIFGGNGLGIKREDMPQIPRDHRQRFLEEARLAGITLTEEAVDPLTLKPTQKEISARRIGQMFGRYERGEKVWNPPLVSSGDRLLDGHHHWGVMAAFALEDPHARIPVIRLHLPTKRALAFMHAYMKKHGISRQAMVGDAVKFDEFQHPRDERGRWTLAMGHSIVKRLGPEYRVVGSVAREGSSAHDLDLLRVGKHKFSGRDVNSSLKKILESQGFDYVGQSVMSPEDKTHEKKKVYGSGWSEVHHFEHSVTHTKIEVWSLLEEKTKKADPTGRYVTPFVSFEKQGDEQLRMIASLNSSRLATWGFTAEAEVRGMARYKLTAVLDGRTSKFCRLVDGHIFQVTDARQKVIEVLNVQNPEDLKVVQPWPKQDKASLAAFAQMSSAELTARGLHIPPYHPHCRTICRVMQSSAGELHEVVPLAVPEEAEAFQAVTAADLQELGIDATQEDVDQWNTHVGMTPVELLTKLSGQTPQEVMTKGKGVGSRPIRFDESGAIGFNVRGASPQGVEFKLGAILDPFTGTYYLSQADLLAGNPKAEAVFLKGLFNALIEMGLKSTATSVAVGVAGNAAYYAKLGFLPDELEWDAIRLYALEGQTMIPEVLASLAPADRLLVEHLLQDKSVSAMSALVELPFTYQNKTIGQWLFGEATGTWALDLTDDLLVAQAKAYLA